MGKDENDKKKEVPFDANMDSFIFTPSLMNSAHFYAYFTYTDAYLQSLPDVSFHNSIYDKNPLLLLLIRDEADLVLATLKSKCEVLDDQPYSLSFINTSTLVELNNKGYSGLETFYTQIFHPCKLSSLPKYSSASLNLPITFYSNILEPIETNFALSENFKVQEIPILFYISNISVNMVSGSQESKDIVKSIINCPNTEIFRTPFIKNILIEKWTRVK